MNAFLETVRNELAGRLDTTPKEQTTVSKLQLQIALVDVALVQIVDFTESHPFTEVTEEIEYYKKYLPDILSQKIFYDEISELEVERQSLNPPRFKRYVRDELQRIEGYFLKKAFLHTYYLKGEVDLDTYFFRRRKVNAGLGTSQLPNAQSEIIATILAYKKYREQLHVELKEQRGHESAVSRPQDTNEQIIEFMGTDADLAEVVPVIHRLKLIRIDGRYATQDEILDIVDQLFKRNLKSIFSVVDNKNRARKKGITPFLQRMVDAYIQRSQDLLK